MRAGEWWEYKLAPIFAVFYATALTLEVPVSSLWAALLVVAAALVPGAAYVSVLNDLTDRDEDLAAGKPNRLAGRSPAYTAALLAVTVGAGIAFCVLWRRDTLLLTVYLAAWLAFSLYSLPPFRFKTRGSLGVVCDASGAHLFPTLVAVILVFRSAHRPVSMPWLLAVGIWAFAAGVRGILWHQLTDLDHDRTAGVRTFAQRHPAAAARVGTFAAFPIELAALASMLWRIGSSIPVAFLAAHALLVLVRRRWWSVNPVIVVPKERFLIVLHEYYELLLPLSVLIASALNHPLDLLVLVLHVAAFRSRPRETLRDLDHFVRDVLRRARRRESSLPPGSSRDA